MSVRQKPNRTPSEHPNPTTKMGSKMGGAPKPPKWSHRLCPMVDWCRDCDSLIKPCVAEPMDFGLGIRVPDTSTSFLLADPQRKTNCKLAPAGTVFSTKTEKTGSLTWAELDFGEFRRNRLRFGGHAAAQNPAGRKAGHPGTGLAIRSMRGEASRVDESMLGILFGRSDMVGFVSNCDGICEDTNQVGPA